MHTCDRQTDRQTDRITTPKTALAYARAVKIKVVPKQTTKRYVTYGFGDTKAGEFGRHTKAAVSQASKEAIASQTASWHRGTMHNYALEL